jgi:hypothetical protein
MPAWLTLATRATLSVPLSVAAVSASVIAAPPILALTPEQGVS